MRHLRKGKKFGRKKGQRKAFMKSLLANLILKEKIETTVSRAKEIKPKIEKLVTLAKYQDLTHQRLLLARLPKKAALKLYYEIGPRFKEKKGGWLNRPIQKINFYNLFIEPVAHIWLSFMLKLSRTIQTQW